MKVISLTEKPDGSALIEVDVTKDELQGIIEVGFSRMIELGMEGFEDVLKSKASGDGEQKTS